MIVGHQKIIQRLTREAEKGQIFWSYIFSGPGKVGKKAVAFDFAKKMLKTDELLSHPDFSLLVPEKEAGEIKAPETKELLRSMSLTGLSQGKRVFMVDEAHRLNRQSQNALLKKLEEPQEGNIIILIAEDERRLLPTIISRCQKIRFSLVGEADMEEIYKTYPEDRKFLEFWSFGRPGLAIELSGDPEKRKKAKETFLEFKSLFDGDFGSRSQLAEKMSREDKADLENKLEIWMSFIRKSILEGDSPIRIAPEKSFRILAKMEEVLLTIRNTQAGRRLILEGLFLEF